MSSIIIGFIGAIGSYSSFYASKKQEKFHNKFRNKSLMISAILISASSLIAGICGLKAENNTILIAIVILMDLIYYTGREKERLKLIS